MSKLDTLNARAHELARLAEGRDARALQWWATKHFAGGAAFAYHVERLLADPTGDGGAEFEAFLDLQIVLLAALRDAKGAA